MRTALVGMVMMAGLFAARPARAGAWGKISGDAVRFDLFKDGFPFTGPFGAGVGTALATDGTLVPVVAIAAGVTVFEATRSLARPRGRLAFDIAFGLSSGSPTAWSVGLQWGVGRFLIGGGLGAVQTDDDEAPILVPAIWLPLHKRLGKVSTTLRVGAQLEAVVANRDAFDDRLVVVAAADFF